MGTMINCYNNKTNIREKKEEPKIIIFEDMEEIKGDTYVGIGIKKMKGYKCNLKIDELNEKREYFWNIKTNYKNKNWKIWDVIKRAVSFDELRASLLLEEYNIKTVNGCINHLVDSDGNYYKIPNYCINEPSFEIISEDEQNIEDKNVKIKIYGWQNLEIEIDNKLKGEDLKNIIKKKFSIEDDKIIRLFTRGNEIKNDDYLYKYDFNENAPVMLMLK
jgi:hypothetical protein